MSLLWSSLRILYFRELGVFGGGGTGNRNQKVFAAANYVTNQIGALRFTQMSSQPHLIYLILISLLFNITLFGLKFNIFIVFGFYGA